MSIVSIHPSRFSPPFPPPPRAYFLSRYLLTSTRLPSFSEKWDLLGRGKLKPRSRSGRRRGVVGVDIGTGAAGGDWVAASSSGHSVPAILPRPWAVGGGTRSETS